MAFNPFRTFQRNQKSCMAGTTLLAIISFLFLGVIIQLLGGRGGGGGTQIETIAECRKFGKITNYELHRLQESQVTLDRFLQQLIRNLMAVDPTDQERMQALHPLDNFIQQMMAQTQTHEQRVNFWLVTQYAQEEGLSPDWNEISSLLTDLTGGYLSDAIYNETLQSIGISHQAIKQLLARHLRWEQSLKRFQLSLEALSPATRWDWYQRLNRSVTIEAAAVPIDSLIDQVGEPTNSQLNALFEKYKAQRYNPESAESGFVMPTELAFQYIVAEPSQQMLDSVTDEEILTFYEENKDSMFRKPIPSLPSIPGMTPSSMPLFPTPGRTDMPAAPMPSDDLPVLPGLPNLPESEGESGEDESVSETSVTSKVATRLVSYQSDEETVATDEGVVAAEASDEPVDLSVLYRPLDEVKDQIRRDLAMQKAVDAFPLIQAEMKKYATVYQDHIGRDKQPPPMPDLTGFVADKGLELVTMPMGDVYAALRTNLARGLQERQKIVQIFQSVPIPFEAETFVGSNAQVLYWVTTEKKEMRPNQLADVKEVVLKRWKEIKARDLVQQKVEDMANTANASEQSLADVFSDCSDVLVVETEPFTWKSYRGVNPYLAVMRRIPPELGEVREKGVAVGDSTIDNQVIVAPGEGFMETVFSLQVGETGVVFNQPQSVAYIVRVTSSSPSTEALWEQFQGAHVMEYIDAGQRDVMVSAFEAWLDEIRRKTGFRWVNKPDVHEWGMYDDGY